MYGISCLHPVVILKLIVSSTLLYHIYHTGVVQSSKHALLKLVEGITCFIQLEWRSSIFTQININKIYIKITYIWVGYALRGLYYYASKQIKKLRFIFNISDYSHSVRNRKSSKIKMDGPKHVLCIWEE